MSKARDKALEAFPISFSERMGYKSANLPNERRNAFEKGYEQALKDMKEIFEQMSNNTNSAIDAVKAIGSLLDNPDIREKLGKSKPIPKKPIKTNPFFGGEKK